MWKILKTGPWGHYRAKLSRAPITMHTAITEYAFREAHLLRSNIIKQIDSEGKDSGSGFKPLKRITAISRALKPQHRFNGPVSGILDPNPEDMKPLIETADLRNSIEAVKVGQGQFFIGVPRSAKNRNGKKLVNIGLVHEFGAKGKLIRITPRMRMFLAELYRHYNNGDGRIYSSKGRKSYIVQNIPARPFLQPSYDKWSKGLEARTTQFMNLLNRKALG